MKHQAVASPRSVSAAARRSLRCLFLTLAVATALIGLQTATALAAGSAVTKPATKVHHTTTVLNGHLDPEGDPGVTECLFEWGTTIAYGNTAPCAQGNAFNAPADVSTILSGLSPGETYHFRLRIETTSNGPFTGADQSFRTIPVPSEHTLITSFGSDGTAGSSFPGPASPAIHQASRKLYVGSRGFPNTQFSGFDASFPPAFPSLPGFPRDTSRGLEFGIPIALDNTGLTSAGNVYFVTEGQESNKSSLNGFSPSGTPLSGFPINIGENVTGLAVNSSGEIWVSRYFPVPGEILKFDSTGALLNKFSLSPFPTSPNSGIQRIVFDSNDNLYASIHSGSDNRSIWKFTAASNYTSKVELPKPSAQAWSLAFDPSSEYLFANTFLGKVAVYDVASGELIDEFESGGGYGIAVDGANHAVYVGSESKIHAYATGAPLLAPTATTAGSSAITGSKATLHGFVDPEGVAVSECKFEYGVGTNYGQSAPCSANPGSGSGDVAVSAEVSGLTPNTTYHYRVVASNSAAAGKGEDEAFTTNPPPVISSPAVTGLAHNAAELKALVDPKGFETTYRFEYGTTTSYGTKVPVPDGKVGDGNADVPVSAKITGLQPDTVYHWRVVAENVNGEVALADQTFTTFGPVKAETTGSPIRSATTAQLQGMVNPDGAATTYRFEYGAEGPCDANPCTATPDRSAGSGGVYRFVAEQVEGLEPDTTYHYRVIAESPTPGGPAIGEDMTVTTRASDAPLSHGQFPGPPGSDRAYEQVSLPDTGGNPVAFANAASDDGNRAFYQVNGGTPLSVTGSLITTLYAERIETAPHRGGWRSTNIFPPRSELVGSGWLEPAGRRDLTDQVFQNVDTTSSRVAIWRLRPGQEAVKLLEPTISDFHGPVLVSEDASRVLAFLRGSHDPAHPPSNNNVNLYDITSGAPKLVGLMPDGSIPSCGVASGDKGGSNAPRTARRVSPDGSLVFFQTCGIDSGFSSNEGLYVRDIVAEQTKLIAGSANLVKSTSDAAFFQTSQSLAPDDAGGTDLYRYDLETEIRECVTCVVPGVVSGIPDGEGRIGVAEDGSRAYFISSVELVRGASVPGIYRVDIASGDLAYVAPGFTEALGDYPELGSTITPDGSVFVFHSSSSSLDALGGQQNGGTAQFYRYDDRDRSLTCVTCPQEGGVPTAAVSRELVSAGNGFGAGANKTALSADGGIFAFATPTPLLDGDQNSARPGQKPAVGTDVYEWRDGRLFLITDGLTNWPNGSEPGVGAVTPSGKDIFFDAAAQYTQDALDGYSRLYTARIGGGFEFPPPPRPCPLEVCQGTPKGAPEEQPPGTSSFSGAGNANDAPTRRPCPKGRRKARKGGKARCVRAQGKKARNRQRANHHRRAGR